MKFKLPFHRSTDDDATPPIERLVLDFESVGDNCEFGLVQRYAGAEPLGLFRFSSTSIPHLVQALDRGLADYGPDGDIEIFEGPLGYLFCRSRRYFFSYNTGEFAAKTEPGSILARETKKVAYLKERFLADLADGEKVLVRKGPPAETFEELMQLVDALRRHGPATVLWVRQATDDRRPGEVAWRGDGVMEGFVERFAPYDKVTDIALEAWLDLCSNGWRLAHGVTETPPAPAPAPSSNLLVEEGTDAHMHVTGSGDTVLATRRASKLKPSTLHTASVWLWLPEDFRGTRMAVEFGRLPLGHREADLAKRGCWQRVWAATRLDKGSHAAELRLRYEGPPGERVWSSAWRLEEGPVPSAGIESPIIDIRLRTSS